MSLWPNATLTKCLFDQNATLTKCQTCLYKCHFDQMPKADKCQFEQNDESQDYFMGQFKKVVETLPTAYLTKLFLCSLRCYDIYRMTHRMTLAEWRTVDQVLAEWHTAELHSAFLILLIDIQINKLECLTLTFLLKFHVCKLSRVAYQGVALPTNIRLGLKGLPGLNTLAYYKHL